MLVQWTSEQDIIPRAHKLGFLARVSWIIRERANALRTLIGRE